MQKDIENLQDIIDIVKRRRRELLLPALAVTALAVLVALVLPPKYRSTSTILIEDQEIPRDYVMSTVTGFAEQRLQTINQRIMSTPNLLAVISRLNLYGDQKSTRSTEELVQQMREDTKFETVSADVLDPRTGQPRPAVIAFTVSFSGRNPEVVQQTANVLASLYLEENLKSREQLTSGTSAFMESEMNQVKKQLSDMDGKIAAFKQQHTDALPELAQFNFQEIERVDRDVDNFTMQLRSLREREGYLESQLASIPTDAANQDRTRLNELRVRLSDLRSRVSEEYPDVRKTKAEIADLERRMRTTGRDTLGAKPDNPAYITLEAQLASTRSEIASVRSHLASLEKKRSAYGSRLVAMPRVEEGYKALLVERTNLQAKYDDLSKKFMEAQVAHGVEKEQKGERFTIIDAARLPERPFSPNRPAIILIGLILGIGAGVGFASLREFTDTTFRSAEALATATGVPVLAAIPLIPSRADVKPVPSRNRKLVLAGGAAAALLLVALLAVHLLVMDLGVLWAKVLLRAGL